MQYYSDYLAYVELKIAYKTKEYAEDITQTVLLNVLTAKNNIENFDAYFKKSAYNELKLICKREKKYVKLNSAANGWLYEHYTSPAVDEEVEKYNVDKMRKLKDKILTQKEKELFDAYVQHDAKNLRELSKILCCNYDTLKVHYRNMLIKFKNHWEDESL